MMNKKGNLGIAIITSIFIFIVGFAALNLLLPEVSTFRVDMKCDTVAELTDATKLLCLAVDLAIPYWIIIIVSVAIGGIVAKFTM